MKTAFAFVAIWSALVLGLAPMGQACTTVVVRDGDALLYARNFDWQWGHGMVIVNQRDIVKTAFVRPSESAAEWTSKYGSVTFNQFGREMPYGGINEAGLVISQMMLLATKYPEPDNRPCVNMLQWIQYQLDNCATVDEVIGSDEFIRPEPPRGEEKIHYLICDAAGSAAAIEYLDGKLVAHRDDSLPVTALANNTYQESSTFARAYEDLGGAKRLPDGRESLHRFTRAAYCSKQFKSGSSEANRDFCFEALKKVAQGPATVWSVVYDIPLRRVYFRTFDNTNVRWFDLGDLDFSSTAQPMFLDINADRQGHVADGFRQLTEQEHKEHLMVFFGKPEVQQRYGNLEPMVDALNALLSTYRPAGMQENQEATSAPATVGVR